MSRRKRLQDRQAAIVKEQETILNKAEEEERNDLTEEEQRDYDALDKELDGEVKPALDREEKLLARQKEMAATLEKRLSPELETPEQETLIYPQGVRHAKPRGFDDAEQAYRCGQWIRAAIFRSESAAKWCADYAPELRVMVGSANVSGGVLIPDELARTIINLQEDYGVFRANANIWPMASDTAVIPRRTGGLTTYWVGEETAITASDMTFDQVTLTARKLATLTKYSTELAEDSVIAIATLIAEEVARAFASKEDDCGFLGTGASTYGGIEGLITACATATATVVTAATGNTAFSTLDLTDFESMIGKLPAYPGIQPKWFISKAGWAASMMRLADAAGGNTNQNIAGGPSQTMFLGYPVVFSQKMNTTLTAQTSTDGLCYFGDLSMAATMGTRRATTIKTSTERYIEYDQLALVATQRFDINVHDVGDTSNAGALIMLSTPAS